MFTSTFIFESKPYDDEFHRLNDEIAKRARAIPGFLGEEAWSNDETGLHSEVYYWESREALHQLIGMDTHKTPHPAVMPPLTQDRSGVDSAA